MYRGMLLALAVLSLFSFSSQQFFQSFANRIERSLVEKNLQSVLEDVSPVCGSQLERFANGLRKPRRWALKSMCLPQIMFYCYQGQGNPEAKRRSICSEFKHEWTRNHAIGYTRSDQHKKQQNKTASKSRQKIIKTTEVATSEDY